VFIQAWLSEQPDFFLRANRTRPGVRYSQRIPHEIERKSTRETKQKRCFRGGGRLAFQETVTSFLSLGCQLQTRKRIRFRHRHCGTHQCCSWCALSATFSYNLTMNGTRGTLIAFEGGDRAGKSTQAKQALQWIRETLREPAVLWHFPNRHSATGRLLDTYLSGSTELTGQVAHLLFAANRWERVEELWQLLDSGSHVILDRYAYSGVAFSVAARGLDPEWCLAADRGLPSPDLVLFLDLDPQLASKRGNFGEERYEQLVIQQRVRQFFLDRLFQSENWVRISAEQPPDQVQLQCRRAITEMLPRVRSLPLKLLW